MNHRAYSTLEIKAVDEGRRTFRGIATTVATDRMGDVVESRGAQFKLPIPLLWQHDAGDPIGWVHSAKVTDKGIEIEGEIADAPDAGPLKERLTLAWQYLKSKLVRGLSIGFNPLESARIEGSYGYRFLKWEWLELSAVTIPANQEATILAVKSFDQASRNAAPGAGGKSLPGASGPTATATRKVHTTMKTIHEQLAELRSARAEKAARLTEIKEATASGGWSAEQRDEFDGLAGDCEHLDDQIRAKQAEALSASTAKAVPPQPTFNRAPAINKGVDSEEKFKGQNFTRRVIAKAVAQQEGISAAGYAAQRWGKSAPTLVQVIRANEVAGGGSGSGEWGAELVTADNRYTGDFIEFLYSMTVYDKLPLREVPANITIKGQDGAATGYWVGESKPIPATAMDFSAVSLTPLKVAAIAVVSNELLRDSSPSAEQFVRDALVEAAAQRIDTTFLSNSAASAGVSPAGLLNGLSAISSAGANAEDVRADIAALMAPFISAKNTTGLYFVTNPSTALQLSLMRNALGQKEFPEMTLNGGTLEGVPCVVGNNVGAGDLILMKPRDIWKIGDMGIMVSVSREAAIEQNSAPTGATDTPVGASTAWTSMFQAESTAFKVVRPMNFQKRRTGVVQFVGDADYTGVSSA